MVLWKGKLAGQTFSNFIQIWFLIQAVYDTLLSPANLHKWRKAQTLQCLLCTKRGSLKHILSSCHRVLGNGHYRWHHNEVLRVIAEVFDKCLRTSTYKVASRRINYIKAGGNVQSEKTSLLSRVPDWELFIEILWSYCSNTTSARYDSCSECDKTSYHVGVNSTMGGKHGRVPWEKAH